MQHSCSAFFSLLFFVLTTTTLRPRRAAHVVIVSPAAPRFSRHDPSGVRWVQHHRNSRRLRDCTQLRVVECERRMRVREHDRRDITCSRRGWGEVLCSRTHRRPDSSADRPARCRTKHRANICAHASSIAIGCGGTHGRNALAVTVRAADRPRHVHNRRLDGPHHGRR
jgi:hypothetical protein